LKFDVDVIVIGGSVSGLLAAREIAEAGFEVKILEDDLEIGVPERCDGFVSMKCLESIGVAPTNKIVQNGIKRGILHSPSGLRAEIDAIKQRVLVLDRKQFDKELAKRALYSGAELELGQRVIRYTMDDNRVKVETDSSTYNANWVINAAGYKAIHNMRNKVLPAAKFEIYGNWFDRETVEIYFDNRKAPGYFFWVIPINGDSAKVGVAGNRINPFKVLEEFVKERRGQVIKKTAAQIVVGGPIEKFVSGHIISVGDAAGQAKPTTGGGIYSSGIGGLLGGKYLGESLVANDPLILDKYEHSWHSIFGNEFKMLLRARKIFEKLDNENIERIFKAVVSSDILRKISMDTDFDFHSVAFLKALGLRNIFQIASFVAGDILEKMKLGN
jgi:geranylgeranyl reductase family protein